LDNKSDYNSIYPERRILQKHKIKIGEFDVRHEIWACEEYRAESIIFENEDIVALTDQDIESLVTKSELVKETSEINIDRLERFTFVIFNFQVGKVAPYEFDETLNEKGRAQ